MKTRKHQCPPRSKSGSENSKPTKLHIQKPGPLPWGLVRTSFRTCTWMTRSAARHRNPGVAAQSLSTGLRPGPQAGREDAGGEREEEIQLPGMCLTFYLDPSWQHGDHLGGPIHNLRGGSPWTSLAPCHENESPKLGLSLLWLGILDQLLNTTAAPERVLIRTEGAGARQSEWDRKCGIPQGMPHIQSLLWFLPSSGKWWQQKRSL